MNSKRKTVAVIGETVDHFFENPLIAEKIYLQIIKEIIDLTKNGYTNFVVNPHTQFEVFTVTILKQLKKENNDINIVLLAHEYGLTVEDTHYQMLHLSEHVLTYYTDKPEIQKIINYSGAANIPITNIALKVTNS